jgi:hypothetical protein
MLGLLGFNGSDGVQMRDAGRVALFVDGVPAAGSMPGKLSFQTTPFGSTAPVERMSIGSYGIIYMAPVVGVESAQTPTLSLGSTNITQAFTRTGDGTLDTIGVGPTSNLASTGGGLCVIRGADSTGQAFVRLYAYIGIVAGGATPVAATLIGSAGAVAPSFALSMVNVGGNNRLRWTGSNTTGGIWWVSYFCT